MKVKWGENRGEPAGQKTFTISLTPMPEDAGQAIEWFLRYQSSGDKEPFWMGTSICSDIKVLRNSVGEWLSPYSDQDEPYYNSFPYDDVDHTYKEYTIEEEVAVYGAHYKVTYKYEKTDGRTAAAKDDSEEAKTDSLHYVEDNKATKDKSDGLNPIIFVIPVLVGGALLGVKKATGKGKKNDRQSEQRPPDLLRLEMYKEVGDTLIVGDKPRPVYACIVRKPYDGPEYVDQRLTQMIRISSSDGYTAVQEGSVINGWKWAYVSAPGMEEGEPPTESIVNFQLVSEAGSYTNRIHFHIQQVRMVFAQDNLTLPAMHDEAVELPFLIVGMEPKGTEVTCKLTPADVKRHSQFAKEEYKVSVRYSLKDELWKLRVADMWLTPEDNEQYQPGDTVAYWIDLEARDKRGFVIKQRYPLYRFYMGLALQFEGSEIGCYYESYDPVHHISSLCVRKQDGREVTPHETRCWLKFYTWDKEKHRIVELNPGIGEDRMTDKGDGPRLDRAFQLVCADEAQQERINQLGMQLVGKTSSNGSPYYIMRPRYGVLNAPNRINAHIVCRCTLGDRELTAVRQVQLLSQPRPTFESPAAMAEWQKKQNRTLDMLEQLDRDIQGAGLGERLAPLVNYLRLHVDAYYKDNHFGFDERCVKAIMTTHHHVLEGLQQEANEHPLVACDNLEQVVWEYYKSMRTTIDDMPMWQKIFLSVATAGTFDVATGFIEVVGSMKDYVDKGGDSVLGALFVGSWQVTKGYLMEKGMAIAGKSLKNYVKTGKADMWKETKNLFAEELNTVKTFGRKLRGAESAKAGNAQANKKADELLKEAKQNPSPKSEYSDDAVRYGRKRAQKNLKELQDSIDALKKDPSPANLARQNEAIIACQQDKQTMMMLKGQSNIETVAAATDGVNFGECRKVLNNKLDKAYTMTNNRVQHRIAKMYPGMKPEDVKVFGATSSSKAKLLSGKSVTFDRDVTYFYVDKATGQTRYFPQKLTEQIYAEEFTEVMRLGTNSGSVGILKSTKDAAREFAKKMDQTVVEDVLKHSESYGVDLPKMLDKALQSQKLTNPEKVAEAVLYKGQERFYIAEKLMKLAKEAGEDSLDLQASAISELIEGCRQQVKVFDLLDARDVARLAENGTSKISPVLREGIAILRRLAVKGNTDVKTAETALHSLGLTFEEVTKEMYRTVLAIG